MVEARNENRLSIYLRQFKKIDLLILDELGYVTFDLAGAELLFQLLATRYETMSTIITSNLRFSDWVKVFHDRALTAVNGNLKFLNSGKIKFPTCKFLRSRLRSCVDANREEVPHVERFIRRRFKHQRDCSANGSRS
jgi:DNA replication protein DnaC